MHTAPALLSKQIEYKENTQQNNKFNLQPTPMYQISWKQIYILKFIFLCCTALFCKSAENCLFLELITAVLLQPIQKEYQ